MGRPTEFVLPLLTGDDGEYAVTVRVSVESVTPGLCLPCLSRGPAVVSSDPGRVHVFMRGRDDALHFTSTSDGGLSWSPWTSLGGILTSDPAAASWGPGRLDVFARGTDNALYRQWTDNGGATWSGWKRVGDGHMTSAPAVAARGPGRLDVFARGTDNTLYRRTTSSGGRTWPGG